MTREDIWEYKERTSRELAALVALSLSLIAAIMVIRDARFMLPVFLAVVTSIMLLLFRSVADTTVVIDRRKGIITKDDAGYFTKKQRTHFLREFDTLELRERTSPLDAGYTISRYSLVLRGKGKALVVLTTADQREALSLQMELSGFLGLEARRIE